MPDIDVFLGWVPWAPLAMHRGFTHGIVGGVLVMPLLLAGLLWLVDRWKVWRGTIGDAAAPLHAGWLIGLCYLGAVTHPLLDLQNVYAIQLLSPWSDHWFHADGLFIVSPWLLALLGAGIWQARKPQAYERRAGHPAVLALAGAAIFIAINIGISALAWRAPETDVPHARPDRVFAAPGPVRFWQREVIWRQNGTIARGQYDPLHSVLALRTYGQPFADGMDSPAVVLAVRKSAVVRDFLDWAQLPFARVTVSGCTARVTIGDARFADGMVARGFSASAVVPHPGSGCGVEQPQGTRPLVQVPVGAGGS